MVGRRGGVWGICLLFLLGLKDSAAVACTGAESNAFALSPSTGISSQFRAALACESSSARSVTATWSGSIPVLETIVVNSNTRLIIQGGEAAAALGGNATQLFQIAANGTLALQGLHLTEGFSNATAGAIHVSAGAALTAVDCSFSSNLGLFGGAIYVADDAASPTAADTSSVRFENCTLSSNCAIENGGSLWLGVVRGATFLHCTASNNTAGWGGAAFYTSVRSSLLISDSLVHDNTAARLGAAFFLYGALSLTRSTVLRNKAGYNGGALFAFSGSVVDILQTEFADNEAQYAGGAMFAESATSITVTQSNVTSNRAEYGAAATTLGALSLQSSTLQSNSAMRNGGAVHITAGGSAVIEGCHFLQNTAAHTAGALLAEYSTAVSIDSSTFVSNTADSGAAVVSAGELTLTQCDFSSNAAQSAGAVALLRGSRLLAESCKFHKNHSKAGSGGALHVESSASVKARNCHFASNRAHRSGAAVFMASAEGESAAAAAVPPDVLTGATFAGNTAGCCFAAGCGQHSSLRSSNSSSSSSVLCSDVDSGSASASDSCCGEGHYSNGRRCLQCDDTMECSGIGATAATLPIAAGHWRAAPASSLLIRRCWNEDACIGGLAATGSANDYCAPGYEGPYCAVCASGYAAGSGNSCKACTPTSLSSVIAVLVLLCLAALLGGTLLLRYLLDVQNSSSDSSSSSSRLSAKLHNRVPARVTSLFERLRRAPWGKLRVPLVVLQILTQFVSITGLPLPPLYHDFLRLVSSVNLSLRWLLPSGCLIEMNFHQELLLTTLLPLALIALLGCVCLVAQRKYSAPVRGLSAFVERSQRLATVNARHCTVFLVFTFLIFSTVSTTVLQTFACDDLKDVGQSWLRADYSILCTSPTHRAYQAYAAVMIFVYPLGIPALYGWLLWRNKAAITAGGDAAAAGEHGAEDERLRDPTLSMTKFLWEPYRKQAYWWEVAECLRRLLLTGFLVFILPGTAGQAAVSCLFAILSMVLFGMARPHLDGTDRAAYWAGCLTLFASMFVALLIEGSFAPAASQTQRAVSAVLIVLNVALVAAALRQIVKVTANLPNRAVLKQKAVRALLSLRDSFKSSSRRSLLLTAANSANSCSAFTMPADIDDAAGEFSSGEPVDAESSSSATATSATSARRVSFQAAYDGSADEAQQHDLRQFTV